MLKNETLAPVGDSQFPDRAFQLKPSVVCLYHANCMDGLISAAIVNLFFHGAVECVPIHYKDEVPVDLMVGRHVYMVDFTFEPEEILPHLGKMRNLTVIDHHHDAMAPWVALAEAKTYPTDQLKVVYNGKRSGAGLVWQYFFGAPGHSRSSDMPILIQYAQEYDLRTKLLPDTDEVQSGLRYNFPPRDAALAALGDFLLKGGPEEVEELRRIGTVILRQEMIMVEAFIKRHLMVRDFLEYKNIPVCYMPVELANQAGEVLHTRFVDAPFVVLFEDNYQDGTRKYSFRSRKDGDIDVSAIAQRFGGKGHFDSSGATVKRELLFA